MKKTLILTAISMLISGQVAAKTWVLTSAESGTDKGNWQITSDQLKIKDRDFSIEQKSSTAANRKAVKFWSSAVKMA